MDNKQFLKFVRQMTIFCGILKFFKRALNLLPEFTIIFPILIVAPF